MLLYKLYFNSIIIFWIYNWCCPWWIVKIRTVFHTLICRFQNQLSFRISFSQAETSNCPFCTSSTIQYISANHLKWENSFNWEFFWVWLEVAVFPSGFRHVLKSPAPWFGGYLPKEWRLSWKETTEKKSPRCWLMRERS